MAPPTRTYPNTKVALEGERALYAKGLNAKSALANVFAICVAALNGGGN